MTEKHVEKQRRWHFWKGHKSTWREGRAHLYHHSQGLFSHLLGPFQPRKDVSGSVEWRAWGRNWDGNVQVSLGESIFSDGSDRNVTCIFKIPKLLAFYLTIDGLLPAWALPNGREHGGREIGLSFHDNKLWVNLWHPGNGSWSSKHPKWWAFTIDPIELILGPERREIVYEDRGRFDVDLPDGKYSVRVQRGVCHFEFPRFGFEGIAHENWSFDEVRGPRGENNFPVPGKGENAWDCGMDGIFACGAPGELSLPEALGNLVGRILERRQQRAGSMRWNPATEQAS